MVNISRDWISIILGHIDHLVYDVSWNGCPICCIVIRSGFLDMD